MHRHRTTCWVLLGGMLLLAGCAKQMVYLLPDGRVPSADPVLSRQFAADTAGCNDERARSVQFGDHGDGSSTRGVEVNQVGKDCMEERGYLLVPQDQAAEIQRKLAAGAAAPARN